MKPSSKTNIQPISTLDRSVQIRPFKLFSERENGPKNTRARTHTRTSALAQTKPGFSSQSQK